jgi:hypothetical protein
METLIRKRPLLAYYVLTFALSWGGFLLGAATRFSARRRECFGAAAG